MLKTKEIKLADISILGTGICLPNHLTLETVSVLSKCKKVFTILDLSIHPVASWLPNESNAQVISLRENYRTGRNRSIDYAKAAEVVVLSAKVDSPIGYLTQGNPIIFDSVSQIVLTEAKKLDLSVKAYAGISSIDSILIDLHEDLAPGLQIYDASFFVAYNVVPRTDVPCLLLQTSVFGTALNAIGKSPRPDILNDLKKHLLQYYPVEHRVHFVKSATMGELSPEINIFALENLDNLPSNVLLGSSLFLPEVKPREETNEFIKKMNSLKNYKKKVTTQVET